MIVNPARLRVLRGLALAGLVVLLLAGAGVETASRGADEPMSEEDVVLLHVSGVPTDEIIARLREAEVDFDLSEEMQEELQLAGLPARLIQAMIERRDELAPPAEPEPVGEPDGSGLATLRILLNHGGNSDDDAVRPVMRVRDDIEPPVYERLRLRSERPRFTDAAIFLACLTQDHVPDQWRSKTPLGRDYVSAPRHKLLAFLPGAEWKETGKLRQFAAKLSVVPGERETMEGLGVLELEVPPEIVVSLEPGVVHDLLLGVALRTEERYYVIRAETWKDLVLEPGERTIKARLNTGKVLGPQQIKVVWVGKDAPQP